MIVLAQAPALQVPEIAWSAISPELALFGAGILVLLLDTAGQARLQASFLVGGIVIAGAGLALWSTEQFAVPLLLALAAVTQFALTALWRDRPRTLGALLTALGFAAAIGVTAWQWVAHSGELVDAAGATYVGTSSALADMVAVDGLALFSRITICVAGLLTVPLSFGYAEDRRIHRGEYYPLLLFAATGMTLLASSADLIMIFISIEILSLALYVLSAFAKRDPLSQEAALKYFLLGALSSAILLYGIALAYGVAGTTRLTAVGQAFTSVGAPTGMTLAAIGLMFVGFAFKTALVPFHMWTPDVYQGAPTPVTGFMAAATKAAAFAALIRVFAGPLAGLQWSWLPVFWVVAVLTMLVGAVLAVVQDDLKRMLAYSSVAHAGYILIGLLALNRDGLSGALLYLFLYAFMTVGSFGVLALLERRGHKAVAINDLRGLGRRYPVPAALLALFLLSLAGIPGTAGFVAKFAVFRAGIEAGQWGLVVVAIVSSAIAAFFYIRVIVAMFMDDESEEAKALPPLPASTGASAGLAVSAAAVVVFGVLPFQLVELVGRAATVLS